jgi:hypothetical protein
MVTYFRPVSSKIYGVKLEFYGFLNIISAWVRSPLYQLADVKLMNSVTFLFEIFHNVLKFVEKKLLDISYRDMLL